MDMNVNFSTPLLETPSDHNTSLNETIKVYGTWNYDNWPSNKPFVHHEAMNEFDGVQGIGYDTKKRFSNSYDGGFDEEDHSFYYNTYEYGSPHDFYILNSD